MKTNYNRLNQFIIRVRRVGMMKTMVHVLITVFLERLGVHFEVVFTRALDAGNEVKAPDGFSIALLSEPAQLTTIDRAALRGYGGELLLHEFESSLSAGRACIVIRASETGIASACWLERRDKYPPFATSPAILISRCFTMPVFRGRGLYTHALKSVDALLGPNMTDASRAFIKCSVGNSSSRAGIEKAGFKLAGCAVEIGSSRKMWKL